MGRNDEILIQCDIIKYLQSKDIYAVYVPNELGGKNAVRTMQAITAGLKPGFSDLIVFLPMQTKPDKIIFVEVKSPKKWIQSTNQKKFEKKMHSFGYDYHLVFSVDDMQKIVENHVAQHWF